MNYLELAEKASNRELTYSDINEVVVAFIKNEAAQDKQIAEIIDGIRRREDEETLTMAEANQIQQAIRRKGVEIMGGKKSAAYENETIRKRVFRDIHLEVKRQYGLVDERGRQKCYTYLRRKDLSGALVVVSEYTVPVALGNDILAENEIGDILD